MGKRRRRKNYLNSEELSFRPVRKGISFRNIKRAIFNWLLLVFIAVITGYAFVTFFYQTVAVVGPSMNDTLAEGEIVVVNKIIYKFHDIERYDIVAIKKLDSQEYYDIKRVIALPGETICIKNGLVYINDKELKDMPVDSTILNAGVASNPLTLGKDEYFILGDNFNNSEDSRYTNVGNISAQEILGKVCYIASPSERRGKMR